MKNNISKLILILLLLISINLGITTHSSISDVTQNTITAMSLPLKKQTSKKLLFKKFAFAMFGVGFSVIAICIILQLYKRLKSTKNYDTENIFKLTDNTLHSPQTIEDAVRLFVTRFK